MYLKLSIRRVERPQGVFFSRNLAISVASIVALALVLFGVPTMAVADEASPAAVPVSSLDTSTSTPSDLVPAADPALTAEPIQPTDPVPPVDPIPPIVPVPPVNPIPPVVPVPTVDPVPPIDPVPPVVPIPPIVPTPPIDPVSTAIPVPEADPIPLQVYTGSTPSAASTAASDGARAAAAERASAYAAAQSTYNAAEAAYKAAKLTYASTKADYDAALSRSTLVHTLATEAARVAETSRRVLATMVRALAQRGSGAATINVLLGDGSGVNLLDQLSALDKLSTLADNMNAVGARVDADEKRAQEILAQDEAAQEALRIIPLAQTQIEMDTAEAAFTSATARLAALASSAQASLSTLTPLANLLAAYDTGQLSDQGWASPAIGSINDVFGPRPVRPVAGVGYFHYATDIGASCGAPIYAATSGIVEAANSEGTYGNWILIAHGDGIETGYAHIAAGATLVSVGESVIAGQVIAGVGSTGASTGCHLHFEVRVDGTRVDPQLFLGQRGVILGG